MLQGAPPQHLGVDGPVVEVTGTVVTGVPMENAVSVGVMPISFHAMSSPVAGALKRTLSRGPSRSSSIG